MKKRSDACLFCSRRNCFNRIVSSKDNGKTYDEVACWKHISDVEKHSDQTAPGIMKFFISSTGKQKRGADYNRTNGLTQRIGVKEDEK
jgi:hypothetical protein